MLTTKLRFALRATTCVSLFVLLALISSGEVFSQSDLEGKRSLDHVDYDRWHTITDRRITNDGKWVLHSVRDGKAEADNTLKIRRNSATKEYSILRGTGAKFTFDSRFVIYRVSPDPKKIKELQKAKTKPELMPGPVLEVLELETGEKFSANQVKSFLVPQENGRWLAYQFNKPVEVSSVKQQNSGVVETYEVTEAGLRRPEKKLKLKKREAPVETVQPKSKKPKSVEKKSESKPDPKTAAEEKHSDDDKKKKAPGTTLVLRDLNTGVQQTYPDVVRYWFSKNGARLAFVTSVKQADKPVTKPGVKSADTKKASIDQPQNPTDGVYVVDLDDWQTHPIATGEGEYKNLAFNEDGSQLAFLTNKDDYKTKTSNWSLYHWRSRQKNASKIAEESSEGIPDGWWVSPSATALFSEDGKRLYFDTAPVPDPVLKERKEAAAKAAGKKVADDDDKPKAKLDVWHWQDPLLQPQQLLQAEIERRRSYRAVYNLRSKKIVQLATREIPNLRIDARSKSKLALAASNIPYRKMLSWDVPGYQDAYLIDLDTGKSRTIIEKTKFNGSLSPEGKYVSWFDSEPRK